MVVHCAYIGINIGFGADLVATMPKYSSYFNRMQFEKIGSSVLFRLMIGLVIGSNLCGQDPIDLLRMGKIAQGNIGFSCQYSRMHFMGSTVSIPVPSLDSEFPCHSHYLFGCQGNRN